MGTFWSDASEGIRDPKRQFRWILLNDNIPVYTLKKVAKPSFTVQESTHKYINHTFYYPGRVSYDPVSVTLVDPVAPDASAKMMQILQQSGYSFPEDQNDTNIAPRGVKNGAG